MFHQLRDKLTYANIVATTALFVALGGTAYAVGAGTIGSREVRDNSLRSRDVRTNTLTARDIDERTLRSKPNVYRRSVVLPVRLVPSGVSSSASGDRGAIAISGNETADGDQFGFRTGGNVQTALTYRGTIYAAPNATGQRRNLVVSVVCLAKARR